MSKQGITSEMSGEGYYNTSQQTQDSIANRPPVPAGILPDLNAQKPNAPPTTPMKHRVCCQCSGAVNMKNDTRCRNSSQEKGACTHDLKNCQTCLGSCYGWFSTTGKFKNENPPGDLQLAEGERLSKVQEILGPPPVKRGYGGDGFHYGADRGYTSRHADSR